MNLCYTHCVVGGDFGRVGDGTGVVEFSVGHILDEGDVVCGVPVQAVEKGVERHSLDQFVDGSHHLESNRKNMK